MSLEPDCLTSAGFLNFEKLTNSVHGFKVSRLFDNHSCGFNESTLKLDTDFNILKFKKQKIYQSKFWVSIKLKVQRNC